MYNFCVLRIQFSCSVVSDSATPWSAAGQSSLSITNSRSLLKLMSIDSVMPSKHLILCHPLLFLPQSFLASGSIPMSQFFPLGGQGFGVSATIFSMDIQNLFPSGLTGWTSLQSKGPSRVFSNTTFKSIISSVLSFLYGPSFTSLHDYWKNHIFDYTDLCQQSDVFVF